MARIDNINFMADIVSCLKSYSGQLYSKRYAILYKLFIYNNLYRTIVYHRVKLCPVLKQTVRR